MGVSVAHDEPQLLNYARRSRALVLPTVSEGTRHGRGNDMAVRVFA